MEAGCGALLAFHIPESLDYRGLLRPPGAEEAGRLDASNADDPDAWSAADVEAALGAVKAATSRAPQECLNLLTTDTFCCAFNLARHFPNLERARQLSFSQILAALCSRAHDLLEKVPPTPYFSSAEAAANRSYLDLERKIAECRIVGTSQHGSMRYNDQDAALMVKPSDMGQVLRSLCHLCVFLVCMTFRCTVTSSKEGEKNTLLSELAPGRKGKASRGSGGRRRKVEDDGNVNLVALELLADSMLQLTRSAIRVPFSGEYGGIGRPDPPLMRMLLDTLMLALSTPAMGFATDKLTDALSRLIKINFDVTRECINNAKTSKVLAGKARQKGTKDPDASEDESDASPVDSARTEDDTAGRTGTCQVDNDWLVTLSEELKKSHTINIADALVLLDGSDIPAAVVNELLVLVRESFVLQASGGTVQMMSSMIQLEYTNVGVFIERMVRKQPDAVLRSLEELKQLLDVPCYNLRKSIMESVKLMVIMAKSEGEEEQADDAGDYAASSSKAALCARHREAMLQLLFARQYDSYMYARASLLKAFQDIIEAGALPIRWLVITASFAISRLWDRGSQVRQRALSLLTTLIEDATTKRFKLPLDAKSLKHDLDIIQAQMAKVDTILSYVAAGSNSDRPAEEMTAQSEDGSHTEDGGSARGGEPSDKVNLDEHVDSTETAPNVQIGAEKCQQLLNELNEELGERITLDDNRALDTLRAKLEVASEMYTDVHEIAIKVESSIQVCSDLLQSSVEGDQRAAIRYIGTCHLMGVKPATKLLPRVWALAWSNNQNVVDSVLHEFRNLYFSYGEDAAIANNLVALLSSSSLTSFASIEKIFEVNLSREQPYFANLDRIMVALLRIALAPNHQLGRDATPRVALGVMRLLINSSMRSKSPLAAAIRTFDEKRLSAIRGLLQLSSGHSCTIFGEVCSILAGAIPSPLMEDIAAYILKLFVGTFGSTDNSWFRMAQCVVDVTFTHCKFAESVWSQTLSGMMEKLGVSGIGSAADKSALAALPSEASDKAPETSTATVRQLAQVIFLSGHVAIRTLISMDRLQSDLKSARADLEALDDGKLVADAANQMGVASSDEQERDLFEQLCEKSIVCANLLGGPVKSLIVACLRNPLHFVTHGSSDGHHWRREDLSAPSTVSKEVLAAAQREVSILKTCSAIALCKMAAVSKRFCRSLFQSDDSTRPACSILEVIISLLLNKRIATGADPGALTGSRRNYYYLSEPVASELRATLLISYGDLLCRHPNLLEPWNDEVWPILLDRDDRVRETAVLVFTHLVMNDMVKPRGKLVDAMMFLTLDTHSKVSDCARTFFHEVDRKNANTIYNCFPEMVATLARNRRQQSVKRNLRVLQMLLKFIRRDRQSESIVEKVCFRLQATAPTDRSAIVVYAHVLLSLCQDERCMAKLIASMPLINRVLLESDILLAVLLTICKRARSSNLGRRIGDGDRQGDSGESTAAGVPAASSGAAGENASIKDQAEELSSRLNALFGERRSSHVTQIAANAEAIIAAAEDPGPGEDDASCAENLFIRNFGWVSAGTDQDLSDNEPESTRGQTPKAGHNDFPVPMKLESYAAVGETFVEREAGAGMKRKRSAEGS
ncbi:condensin subunit [Babesia ovata]|uniref:Condensin subunit n=1 Tax=Babesia ovata TaxID=189622 RepID=A0A2H6KFF4_9APIC|nr:condensin subunit [Babesia ovata]GBE61722.1 condensin subunit [Babesia ovata]